jgi:hypothetical protein
MYVDVPHLDRLLVAAPITLEGLDHLIKRSRWGGGAETLLHQQDVSLGTAVMSLA